MKTILACLIGASFFSVVQAAEPAVPDLNQLCSALTSIGIAPGTWRPSFGMPGGWVCSNMGQASQFGPYGPLGLPSNVSYFVTGSGPSKLDQVEIKLNINNTSTTAQGKSKLVSAARKVLSLFGQSLPKVASDKIATVKPYIDEVGVARTKTTTLFESAFPGYTLRITQTENRITSVVVTIRSTSSSGIWY